MDTMTALTTLSLGGALDTAIRRYRTANPISEGLQARAAERGAERCLAHLGLENGHAARDIRDFNVNANQLTPIGKGEFYPITSNETPDGRQKNRRTVVVLRPVLPAVPVTE